MSNYIDESLPEGQFDWDTWAQALKNASDPISEAFFDKVMESGLVDEIQLTEDEEAINLWNKWHKSIKG